MIKRLFYDTYALIEIYKENPNYEKYKKGFKIILNKLNLLEFSYFLFREGRGNEAKEIISRFSKFNIDYDNEILLETAKMKFEHKKEFLSYIDCIGYLLAKKYNVKFLTGDEKFRDMENVEFVK